MITHIGWLNYVGDGGERRFLESFISGVPKFTTDIRDSKFMDEYEARQLRDVLVRMGHLARIQYVPFWTRAEWGRTDVMVWGG